MQHAAPVKFVSRRTQVLFHRLKGGLKKVGYSDSDVFLHIADLAVENPLLCRALSLFIRDVLVDIGHEDHPYEDILAEAYRRMLFDPQHFDRHGAIPQARDEEFLAMFVELVVLDADGAADTFLMTGNSRLH